jgi:uncharacterized protein (TIGR03067 family)
MRSAGGRADYRGRTELMKTTGLKFLATAFLGGLLLSVTWSLRAQSPDASTFSLAPGDITEAVIGTTGGARLKVMLTPAKSAELATLTKRNLNRPVKIVIDGKLRAEPFVRERMTGPSLEIFVRSPEEAVATIKALLTSKVAFEQLHQWTDGTGQTHYSEAPPSQSAGQVPVTKALAEDPSAYQALQGSWYVTQATMNGRENNDPSLVGGNWIFKGSELILHSPQKGTVQFTLKLDPNSDPRAFHLTAVQPVSGGSGWMLFARERNSLKIAFHDNLAGRPASFTPREPGAKPPLIVVTLSPQ